MNKRPLTQEQFDNYFDEVVRYCEDILCSKNKEYAPGIDKLANFRAASSFSGLGEKQVLFGYMLKHWDSVKTMIMSTKDYSEELWREKITDSINYLIILYSMVREDNLNQKGDSE